MRLEIDSLRLGTGQNVREHWRAASRRKKREKESVWAHLRSAFGLVPPNLPLTITVTRVGPRPLDNHDNLPASCKYVVDEIARWVAVDDRDPGYAWRYAQQHGAWAVIIEIEEGARHA